MRLGPAGLALMPNLVAPTLAQERAGASRSRIGIKITVAIFQRFARRGRAFPPLRSDQCLLAAPFRSRLPYRRRRPSRAWLEAALTTTADLCQKIPGQPPIGPALSLGFPKSDILRWREAKEV